MIVFVSVYKFGTLYLEEAKTPHFAYNLFQHLPIQFIQSVITQKEYQ